MVLTFQNFCETHEFIQTTKYFGSLIEFLERNAGNLVISNRELRVTTEANNFEFQYNSVERHNILNVNDKIVVKLR